jgi:cell surface protein SprA
MSNQISLKFNSLTEKESRGVFKTVNFDLRQYGKLDMFVHAEEVVHPGFIRMEI